MKTYNKRLETCFDYIEDTYCCKAYDNVFGKNYVLEEQFGTGNFLRFIIEDGLEIKKMMMNSNVDMYFDNREFDSDILELGYCYSGHAQILTYPDKQQYIFKEGDIFFYRALNNVDFFELQYMDCKTISIHMNVNLIKRAINVTSEERSIMHDLEHLNHIFEGNTLIIETASYALRQIAREIDLLSSNNVVEYMKLKLKTTEFLVTLIEEKMKGYRKSKQDEEREIVANAKAIIKRNLENVPTVRALANALNVSVYTLQKAFKDSVSTTVYEYVKKIRLEKAQYLLKNTDMSILQITNEIGYDNPSKFANLFKRYNDVTPLNYRKRNKMIK